MVLDPDSTSYLSIEKGKAYSPAGAAAVRSSLDLALIKTPESAVLEFYNLQPEHEKVPASLCGTQTKLAAISFDRDQFDNCKTVADLKRMTGYLTTNSFSHFAVLRSSADYYQRCFILERENGKRALLFVTALGGDSFKAEIRTE